MFWQRLLILTTFCSITLLLPACSSNGKRWNPEDYTVKSGDTIYSIAWRYEIDPEEFADWNGLRNSAFIKPGQRLHTRKPANYRKNRAKKTAQRTTASSNATSSASYNSRIKTDKWLKAEKGDTLYGLSKTTGISVERLAQLNQLKKPYVIQPGQTIFLKPLKPATPSRKNTSTQTPKHSTPHIIRSKPQVTTPSQQSIRWPKTVRWQRPARGKVIKKFNRRKNDAKGIDISGKKGNAIVAAAKGKVVYSGNGLISYGNLIIIKHNKTFLSAYAYNRKLLVKEGDIVKAGEKIAEMGYKEKNRPILHFEIRKNGKPVDPLKYLPR